VSFFLSRIFSSPKFTSGERPETPGTRLELKSSVKLCACVFSFTAGWETCVAEFKFESNAKPVTLVHVQQLQQVSFLSLEKRERCLWMRCRVDPRQLDEAAAG
jgi:hypothetical protein